MDVAEALVTVIVVFFASAAQGLTAFGFALIVVPFLLLVVDVQDAVVLASLLGTANVALLAMRVWRQTPRGMVARLVGGSFAGMPAGLAVLVLVPDDALRIVVGVSAVTMAALLARGMSIAATSVLVELAVGTVSGILRTSTGMAGPPVVLYLQGRRVSPAEFRAALTIFFLITSLVSIGAFGGAGVISTRALVLSAIALPAVYLGNWSGDRALRLVDPELFRRIVLLLLSATALAAVGSAIERLVT